MWWISDVTPFNADMDKHSLSSSVLWIFKKIFFSLYMQNVGCEEKYIKK